MKWFYNKNSEPLDWKAKADNRIVNVAMYVRARNPLPLITTNQTLSHGTTIPPTTNLDEGNTFDPIDPLCWASGLRRSWRPGRISIGISMSANVCILRNSISIRTNGQYC